MKDFLANFECGFLSSIISDGITTLPYDEFFTNADKLACSLKKLLPFQTRVAIIANPSVEWMLCDIALLKSGMVSVPMFANASNETLKFQIEESRPLCLIVENYKTLSHIQSVTEYRFSHIFVMCKNNIEGFQKSIWDLISDKKNIAEQELFPQSTIATIIYTSGTSGNPKGVMLSHSNFAHQIEDITRSFSNISNTDTAISILPLAHVFQRTITYFYLSCGVSIHIINDIPNILKHIKNIQPTLIVVVPRILEKVYAKIKFQIESKPKVLQKLVMPLFSVASSGVVSNIFTRFLLEIILFRKVRVIFGKQIKLVVCGGAKLSKNEEIFFHNAKLPVCQGYGMTESSPVIASNNPQNHKLCTVGKPLSSVEVKIAQNGEICIRGGSVFVGYFGKNPHPANEFFPTGDLGIIDAEGFLTVTGRIKEQCKTANGKFVDLPRIESMLNEIQGVEISCVVAEGKPFVTAILFTKNHTYASIKTHIHAINSHLNHHEQIQYFYITNENPTPENNVITPSMKLRRNSIYAKYQHEIENFYKKT